MIFAYAADQEYLLRTPMPKVKKIKSEKKGVQFMSNDQVAKLMGAMEKSRLRPLFHFILSTGTRRGEALGLTWQDVDFENEQVMIRQALVKDKEKTVKLGSLKRDTSVCQIPLLTEDFAQLQAWQKAQDEEKELLGKEYVDKGFVFCRANGLPIHPDTPGEWL